MQFRYVYIFIYLCLVTYIYVYINISIYEGMRMNLRENTYFLACEPASKNRIGIQRKK